MAMHMVEAQGISCLLLSYVSMAMAFEALGTIQIPQRYNLNFWNKTSLRSPRLSFINLISPLSNVDNCNTTSGLSGSCLSAQDCRKRGGRGIETCAWGLGVCCVHIASCGDTTTANMTYFTSPNYPGSTSRNGVCDVSLKLHRFSRICQLRLDFEDFILSGPAEETGMCSSDLFVISGQDLNNVVPVICGKNTGQHVYIQVGSNRRGPYRFTVTTSGEAKERKWKIRITQINCGSEAMAPAHCLQYYTGAVGKIRSFNYIEAPPAVASTYPTNLNYAICLRKEAAMCGATFTADGNFGVDVARTGSSCSLGDYLNIGTTRICGDNTTISTNGLKYVNPGPMMVTFVSDDTHGRNDIGFNLHYTQFACSVGN